MTDPLDALRVGPGPVDPDPAFATALRARIERALLDPLEDPMTTSVAETTTDPGTVARLHTVTPYLVAVDARASVAFYIAAFGAVPRGEPIVMPDGRVGHVEVALGDSVLMLADEFPELGLRAPASRGGPSQSLRLETSDPDGVVAAAVAAGAVLERPVADSPYGRGGVVDDLDGHRWMVSSEAPVARPGDVIYASLWAPDAARTRRFYDEVLGSLGSLGTAEAETPILMCCYEVVDVDAAITLVRAAGGAAGEPREESHGRTADCVDDQGIPFAVHAGHTPPMAGPLQYIELRVPDALRARAFYGTVLGWGFQPGSVADYWHPLRHDGGMTAPVTGLLGGAERATVVPTFAVADIGARIAAVRSAGGQVADRDAGGYSGVTCTDDQGAPFHLQG
jgi:uncharacterized glyoxalase superfamily protein PhnB/predicted enzyme related to lactoylglutathione lyase